MNIPILAFDFDGTLLDPQSRIHPMDAALLRTGDPRAYFILATGRCLESVRTTFAKNNLFVDRPLPIAMVLNNGALCLLPGEKVVLYTPFSSLLQDRLIDLAGSFPGLTILFFSQDEIFMMHPTPFGLEAAQIYGFTTQPFSMNSRTASFSKMMCLSANPELLEEMRLASACLPVEGSYSMPTLFELAPPGVNKASGLKTILNELGYSEAPVFAAGDGGNDLAMLEMATISFTPATSPPEIRDAVDVIIDTSRNGLLMPMMEVACTR